MKITEQIQKRTEELQNEAQGYIDQIVEMYPQRAKSIDYDSYMAVWNFTKLAEMELRIEKLETGKVDRLTKEEADELLNNIPNL